MTNFDVFLCHNSEDKPAVKQLANQLKELGIRPWLDEWELRPGQSWQWVLEQQIEQIASAAVFVGSAGLGPWQREEIYAFLQEFQQRSCPVIPVLLSNAPEQPRLPVFLRNKMWVDFRKLEPEPMGHLIWGITGIKPGTQTIIHPPLLERPSRLPETTPKPLTATDDLASEKGIDYTRLRDLLKAGKWKEADTETYRMMLQAVGKKDGGWFTSDELLNFPCTDLRTINQLWVKYSKGHFGFSVQKEIYLSVGGQADGEYYEKAWEKFGDAVGWRVNSSWIYYDNVTFDTSSPRGHLPVFGFYLNVWGGKWGGGWLFSSVASRLVKSNI